MTTLPDYAYAAAYHGTRLYARYILLVYGDYQRWTDETRRARWDGAASLLAWWHEQDKTTRPPLDNLNAEDVGDYLRWLETQGLARSTMRGYRCGARALTKALHGARSLPVRFDPSYDPFMSVQLSRVKKPVLTVSKERLEQIESPLARARLELLLALLDLGMSVPEVCACRWFEVNLTNRTVLGYRQRLIRLGAPAVEALTQLLKAQPEPDLKSPKRMLGWNPDTARRWLKQVQSVEIEANTV